MGIYRRTFAASPLPGEFFGDLMLLDRGFGVTLTLDFQPGVYMLACFHPSAAHEDKRQLATVIAEGWP